MRNLFHNLFFFLHYNLKKFQIDIFNDKLK